MSNEMRLPRNAKEGLIFMLIVSIISVNTIAPLIMGYEFGFSKDVYLNTLRVIHRKCGLPCFYISLRLFKQYRMHFFGQLLHPVDRVVTITKHVTILSICLTVIGAWVGQRQISLDPIREFFYHWPKNFFIAFWIEILLAQPIARFVLKTLHVKQAAKAANNVEA